MNDTLLRTTQGAIVRALNLKIQAEAYCEVWGGSGNGNIEADIVSLERSAAEAKDRADKYIAVCFPPTPAPGTPS